MIVHEAWFQAVMTAAGGFVDQNQLLATAFTRANASGARRS